MKSTEPTIWLVRHGESEANAGLPSQDPASIPLTPRGRRQADSVSELIDPPPELIITSPFIRTRQTAEAMTARNPSIAVETWPVQEFTFLGAAAYRGSTVAQRSEATQDYWNSEEPRFRVTTDAESFADFCRRLDDTLARLATLGDRGLETVVVVSHRKFIAGLIWRLLSGDRKISKRRMSRFRAFDTAVVLKNAARVPIRIARRRPWIGPIEAIEG